MPKILSKSKLFMIFYSASLKTPLQNISVVISMRFISLQHLAAVCHHVCVPSSLVSALHNHNILVKTLTLLFIYGTNILRKEVNMRMQIMQFSSVLLMIFSNFSSHSDVLISDPTKMPSLILASDKHLNLSQRYMKQGPPLDSAFTNCLIMPNLM